jgi:hypothetical protein
VGRARRVTTASPPGCYGGSCLTPWPRTPVSTRKSHSAALPLARPKRAPLAPVGAPALAGTTDGAADLQPSVTWDACMCEPDDPPHGSEDIAERRGTSPQCDPAKGN